MTIQLTNQGNYLYFKMSLDGNYEITIPDFKSEQLKAQEYFHEDDQTIIKLLYQETTIA
ncbi:hypothetical protein [Tannockella kyphosi]|uniref:hypothetical protein n=1 Tax=Tannockella kyphosi TaxID=2899121 RepID=UPI002013B769|nr:hypothetical protein [Tannockella kyphosi]